MNVTFKLLSAEQFVQVMQELSLPVNMILNNTVPVKRVKILEAITYELNHNYKDKKTQLVYSTIRISEWTDV